MYSAVKVDGVRLYTLARKGVEVDVAERTVHIDHIEMISYDAPHITFEVTCSPGTYIRTLAVGHRTSPGNMRVFEGIEADPLRAVSHRGGIFPGYIRRPGEKGLGAHHRSEGGHRKHGRGEPDTDGRRARLPGGGRSLVRELNTVSEGSTVKLVYEGRLLALGRVETQRKMKVNIRPFKVFHR